MAPRVLLPGLLLMVATASFAEAQTDANPAPPAAAAQRAPGETRFVAENITRAEAWRFFEPPVGGGVQPNYVFGGSRFTLGAKYDGPRLAMHGAIQYVRIENLPRGAIGPGLLGTGGAYFFQAVGTFSYQLYLRTLSLRVNDVLPGVSLEAGRFSMTQPEQRPDADAGGVEALDRSRVAGRLLGDMEWSLYQRAWDGVRVVVQRDGWAVNVIGVRPTQGTFEESANLALDRLHVIGVDVAVMPGVAARRTKIRAFGTVYDDARKVRARPDNSGVPAAQADVRIGTVGASAVGAYPHGPGQWDAVLWIAGQAGDWYGEPHRALSVASEGGYQWPSLPGRLWLRAGSVYASGDNDDADGRHNTFFQMLPSGDQFVRSNTYALMNVIDLWAEARFSPGSRVDVSAAVHHVSLASVSDRWYSGSGATERSGNFFGFLTRHTRGARTIGTIVEGTATWRPMRAWTLRAYAGHMAGGDAVQKVFAGRRLLSAWVESAVRF